MILYNITLSIEKDIVEPCLRYLKQSYIPQATRSRVMHSPKLHRVLPHDDNETGTESYAIQFNVKNVDTLNFWIEHEGVHISKQLLAIFGNKVIGFTTVLEEIELPE